MLCGQVAAYAAHHRVCAACGLLQPLKDRRTRRLQTLFGTIEVEAPRFKVCRCRQAVDGGQNPRKSGAQCLIGWFAAWAHERQVAACGFSEAMTGCCWM